MEENVLITGMLM